MSNKINTPMGEISILIDGFEVEYTPEKAEALKRWFPNVLGRYFIKINHIPDGKPHKISCVFPFDESIERSPESGDHLECQAFYDKDSFKLSIGTYGETNSEFHFDYDIEYLQNGMQYIVLPETKTQEYEFGICWIDNVDSDEYDEDTNDRDTQTWLGADPTYYR